MKPRTAEEILETARLRIELCHQSQSTHASAMAESWSTVVLIIEAMIALHNKPRPGERKIELLPKDPE